MNDHQESLVYLSRTMDEILGTRINIKFCKSKLELEIKRNAQWIQIRYKTYVSDTIYYYLLFI